MKSALVLLLALVLFAGCAQERPKITTATPTAPAMPTATPKPQPTMAPTRTVPPTPVFVAPRPKPRPSAPMPPMPPQRIPTGSVHDLIVQVFGKWSGSALRVATCESGLNPNAYNSIEGATGVFQFLYGTWVGTPYRGYARTNAWANVHAAYWVFQKDGYTWREWQCKP